MTKEFDPTRPVQTRDGRPARIISTGLDGYSGDTIVAAVREGAGTPEYIKTYQPSGAYVAGLENGSDLINVPEIYGRDAIGMLAPAVDGRQTFYVNLGDSALGDAETAVAKARGWPVAHLSVEGERIISAEFVTVDEVEAA